MSSQPRHLLLRRQIVARFSALSSPFLFTFLRVVRDNAAQEAHPSEAAQRNPNTLFKKTVRGNDRNPRKPPCSRFAPEFSLLPEKTHRQSTKPVMSKESLITPTAASPVTYLSFAPRTPETFEVEIY